MLSNGGFKLGLCVSEFPVLQFGTAAERQILPMLFKSNPAINISVGKAVCAKFIVTLLLVAKDWKHPKCFSAGDSLNHYMSTH